MAKSEKFNASINFGASIDSSLGKSLKWLTNGIQDTEKTTIKAMGVQTKWMRDLQNGSSTTASKMKVMEQSMGALVKKQESLETKIRAGVRAGEDVSKLTDQYKTVAVGISRAEKELERLNAEREKELKLEQKQAKAAKRVEQFMSIPGRAAHSALGAMKMGATATKWAALGGFGVAGSAIGGTIALNSQTAELASQAAAYHLDPVVYQSMGHIAKQAGLNAENAGDLVEELTNKMGPGNEKQFSGLLRNIGYAPSQFKGLDPQDAFFKIMGRLSTMRNTSAAASLADQFFGGEGNKFITYVQSTGRSFQDLMNSTKKYNLLTSEGVEGAKKANTAMDNFGEILSTGIKNTVGEISGQLSPYIETAGIELGKTIKEWAPKLTQDVIDWLKPDKTGETGPQRLWHAIGEFGEGVKIIGQEAIELGSYLSFLLPDKRAPEEMETAQEARQRAIVQEEKRLGVPTLEYAQSIAVANAGEAAWREAHSGTGTLVSDYHGFDDDQFGGVIPTMPGAVSNTHNNSFNVTIQMQGGDTPEDAATRFTTEINNLLGNWNKPSATYDVY